MDQLTGTIIAATVPTLAVIAAFVRNESALASLNGRIETLTRDMNARFETVNARFETVNGRIETLTRDMNARFEAVNGRIETMTREMNARFETVNREMNVRFETLTRRVDSVSSDLRTWAQITMQHNTDIARLKDKTGLPEQK